MEMRVDKLEELNIALNVRSSSETGNTFCSKVLLVLIAANYVPSLKLEDGFEVSGTSLSGPEYEYNARSAPG